MKIAFVSTKNQVRSIIAEAVAKKVARLALLSPDIISAGVQPTDTLPKEVIDILKEKGYETENLYPKGLEDIDYENTDILVTLSPEARDSCAYSISHKRREHWNLEEPKSLKREELTSLVEQVESLVRELFKIS
ncbi:MAG: low molecular weight phosphatase family protein [Acidobacteria bacterium]|jgi:protein-tyrosine-phosphatase|nr:MAG: low molecular weight phosphatase family protein [Acidobacteriota bacterium]